MQEQLLQAMLSASPEERQSLLLSHLSAQAQADEVEAEPAPDAEFESRLAVLEAENEFLGELSRNLADALGACFECWGQDRSCSACRGDGGPGWQRPEPTLFREVVMPAVRRVHASQSRRRRKDASRHDEPQPQPPTSTKDQ